MTANPDYDFGNSYSCGKKFLAIAQPQLRIKPLLNNSKRNICYFTVENDDYPDIVAVEFDENLDPVNHYYL